jgi:hypothetical protein
MRKKVLTTLGLSILLATLVFVGCKKEELIKYVGIIQGVVYDGNTNAPIDGVTVKLMVDGVVVDTLSTVDGYSVADLPSGEYYLTFSKTGYATTVVGENIPVYLANENPTLRVRKDDTRNEILFTRTLNPVMYTLDGAVSGTVYKMVNGYKLPAEGFTVQVLYQAPAESGSQTEDGITNQGLTPNLYTAVTDAEGNYELTALPAGPGTITILAKNDGTTDFGASATLNVRFTPGTTITTGDLMVYQANSGNLEIVDGNIIEISSGIEKLDVTENITMTFNQNIASKEIKLWSNVDNRYIPVTTSGKALTTITVDPQEILNVGGSYTLDVYAISSENETFHNFYNFSAQDGIEFVSTNLEIADGQPNEDFVITDNITFNFSMTIDAAKTAMDGDVTLRDEDNQEVLVVVTYSENMMTIDPVESLEPGMDYNVAYTVYSSLINDNASDNFDFTTALTITVPGQVGGFKFDDVYPSDYKFDHDATGVLFQCNAVAGAEDYEVWAKDNKNNTDWIYLGSGSPPNDYEQENVIHWAVALPSQFDYFEDDGVQTPLSHDTQVSFKVRATNEAGDGIFSGTILTISDTQTPDRYSEFNAEIDANSWGHANNSLETDDFVYEINIDAVAGFYFDTTDASLVLLIEDNGGDNLSSSQITLTWTDHQTGTIRIQIPDGDNYLGHEISIAGLRDASGNESSDLFTIILQ